MNTSHHSLPISLATLFVVGLVTVPMTRAIADGVDPALLHAPATHVPHDFQQKPQEGVITHVPQQIPAAPKTPTIRPDTKPAPHVPMMPQAPVMPSEPDIPGQRTPDHHLDDPARDGRSPATDRIYADSVNRLFEDAIKVHPAELEGLHDAEGIRDIPGIEGTAIDPHALPGQGDTGLIPGQQRRLDDGPTLESQGFQRPDGMPESPIGTRTGEQGPRRLVGPPSADLRAAGAGAAATHIPTRSFADRHGFVSGMDHTSTSKGETTDGSRVVEVVGTNDDGETRIYREIVRPDGTSTRQLVRTLPNGEGVRRTAEYDAEGNRTGEPRTENLDYPPAGREDTSPGGDEPLDRLQDGDADVAGGSGINPITGLPTRPPKQHPDQVNPGPEGAVVMPAGVRLRGVDLEVNPDPERHRRGYDPSETIRRFESPDPGPMP